MWIRTWRVSSSLRENRRSHSATGQTCVRSDNGRPPPSPAGPGGSPTAGEGSPLGPATGGEAAAAAVTTPHGETVTQDAHAAIPAVDVSATDDDLQRCATWRTSATRMTL